MRLHCENVKKKGKEKQRRGETGKHMKSEIMTKEQTDSSSRCTKTSGMFAGLLRVTEWYVVPNANIVSRLFIFIFSHITGKLRGRQSCSVHLTGRALPSQLHLVEYTPYLLYF